MDPFTNCARKDKFDTRAEAEAFLRQWRKDAASGYGNKIVGHVRVFRCRVGRHYHIGRVGGARNARGSKRKGRRWT